MSSKHLRGDFNYAWPTAEVAVMGAKVCNQYNWGLTDARKCQCRLNRVSAWANIFQLKLGNSWEISGDIPQFSKLYTLRKDVRKDDKHDSLHLAQKYARIFVLAKL